MRNQRFYFIVFISVCVGYCASTDGSDDDTTTYETLNHPKQQAGSCWMTLGAQKLFQVLEKIDKKYATARTQAQECFDNMKVDDSMIENILTDVGAAYREFREGVKLPSGINLGGLCMIKMRNSIIFFHRVQLREDTFFELNYLHNDMENMVLRVNLSLNTLHLIGAYDRCMLDSDPSALIYAPSLGELQIVMKNVQYTVQGRYRLMARRPYIEVIVSTLDNTEIALTYEKDNDTEPPMMLEKKDMGDFIMRLKADLDKWIKDYFNDYFLMKQIPDVPTLSDLENYDNEKAKALAEFTDDTLSMMNKKLNDIGGDVIRLPDFKILASYGLTISMYSGTLRGLNTMFRRSIATTILEKMNLRYVDTIIGFNDFKVSYDYEVIFPPSQHFRPTLNGAFIMSTNELSAHLSLGLLNGTEMVELDIGFIKRLGAEFITVEGGANLHTANFKHLLLHEIATIMSSSVTYGVRLLKTLPKCEPFVPGMLQKKAQAEIIKMRPTPQNVIVLKTSEEKE